MKGIIRILNTFAWALAVLTMTQACSTKLVEGDRTLSFDKTGDRYEAVVYLNDIAAVNIGQPAISIKNDTEGEADATYCEGYTKVRKLFGNISAVADIRTANGSEFRITDVYTRERDAFTVLRNVEVRKAMPEDSGFSSTFSAGIINGEAGEDAYDWFIPSILYRNTEAVRADAVGADLSGEKMYVKETRTGMPLAMMRNKKSGITMTLLHYNPKIDIGQNPGGGMPGEVNDELEYGSVGFTVRPAVSADYTYPCKEGPRTYERVDGRRPHPDTDTWLGRYHSVTAGNSHSYELAIFVNRYEEYTDAMAASFTNAYKLEKPHIADVDMDSIYQDNIDIFKAEYKSFGTGELKAPGLPWSLDLPDGTNREGISYQMGFVGQQIAVGYHLYRYGKDNNEPETVEKGRSIVDFWTSETIMGTYFPTVWWDPADNETAGKRRNYPSFLRCFVDGMEGLLDACRIAEAYGDRQERWENALLHVADNLVARQNPDGSFYRAYRPDGEVETGGDRNTHGSSRLNTPVAVRFLIKMYEHTGNEKFKDAAIKAAEFSYDELYVKLGKYVGGTPDNPNTVDKEAAIFAMYAFNAAHELTGEEKYLKAAEHAAISVMTWAYCYDFAIPHRNEKDTVVNPFANGGTLGFSMIATGHSASDNFIAYVFFELYKLYIKTGNEIYLNMAEFIQHDTKLNTDYDGRMGYKYRAFMPEATNIADLAFSSVSLWLPWSSIANIEPIVQLEEAFGCKDIKDIDLDLEELKARLKEYGAGGRKMKR